MRRLWRMTVAALLAASVSAAPAAADGSSLLIPPWADDLGAATAAGAAARWDAPAAISALTPESGTASGGELVTILGSNFRDGSGVLFGDTPAASVTVERYDRITAVAPAHAAGVVELRVVTHAGPSGPVPYEFVAPPPPPPVAPPAPVAPLPAAPQPAPRGCVVPALTGLTVPSARRALRSADCRLTAVRPKDWTSAERVTGQEPARGTRLPDGAGVAVRVGGRRGARARANHRPPQWPPPDRFTPPVIGTVSATSGTTDGGEALTITGGSFRDGSGVLFGDTPAAAVTVERYDRMTVITPAHAAGAVELRVVTRTGTSGPVVFTFVAPPAPVAPPPAAPPAAVPPAPAPAPASRECVVPSLRGLTMSAARRALERAHCQLAAARPRPRKPGDRVKQQSPAPDTRLPEGSGVAVRVRRT
jgi:hypothetical protein